MVPWIPWYVACMIANAGIMAVEYINRITPGGWHNALPKTLIFIVIAQWSLYHAWVHAPHWFSAWIVFTIGNSLMRILAVQLGASHEVVSWGHAIAGIAIMMAGALLVKMGLR